MKIKVQRAFLDITNLSHRFSVGEVVEFSEERAKHIIAIGFGVEVAVAKPAKEATAAPAEEEAKENQEPAAEKVETAAPSTKKVGRKKKVSE